MTNTSPDLQQLFAEPAVTLHQEAVGGSVLAVKENTLYRWYEHGGQAIQSVVNKQLPAQVVTPVSQSLLLFLLFKPRPGRVLNLGLGGATFERYLAGVSGIQVTSVEVFQPVIDMARRFFYLPEASPVVCQQAQAFVTQTQSHYDAVICDVFLNEQTPQFLSNVAFYTRLASVVVPNGVLLMNTQPESEEELLQVLLALRAVFAHVALIEFDSYRNVVVVCSACSLPPKEFLLNQAASCAPAGLAHLAASVERMRYLP